MSKLFFREAPSEGQKKSNKIRNMAHGQIMCKVQSLFSLSCRMGRLLGQSFCSILHP